MEKLKQYVDKGKVQIAKLDDQNNPHTVPYQQMADEVNRQNKHIAISKMIKSLSWDEKYEWVNIKRLKGKQHYQNKQYNQAIQCYLESLVGIDLNDNTQNRLSQMKNDLQYPITLNIAVCLYKKNQYKKAIHLCDKILQQNSKYLPAIYKKVYLLIHTGDYSSAKSLLNEGIQIAKQSSQQEHLKNLINLNGQLMKSSNKNKNVYTKMFNQERDSQVSTSAESEETQLVRKKSSKSSQKNDEEILYYEEDPTSICGKIARAFKSAIGCVIPSLGTEKHKIKKMMRTAKSI